jgi:UDP-N-acetylmuramoyl-L-alanyl-D-glutamate--2,6-diaminopimelate ligase
MTAATYPTPTRRARLAELTAGLVDAPATLEISDVTLDSRAVSPGSLFLACHGRGRHGAEFSGEAVARGACALLYESSAGAREMVEAGLGKSSAGGRSATVFVAAVPELSRRAGLIADRFFSRPSQTLAIAGITGTNGKTTCAWLLAQALSRCHRPAAYFGTIGFGFPGALAATEHTTVDAVSIHRRLAAMRAAGAAAVSMEVSSHALDQERVGAVRFHTAAFTNLTRDHLDYHGTMAAYAEAKARLFDWPGLAVRVINVDDEFGARLAARRSEAQLVVTTRRGAASAARPGAREVRAVRVEAALSGLLIDVETSWGAA